MEPGSWCQHVRLRTAAKGQMRFRDTGCSPSTVAQEVDRGR
jgi:hypothetical protein